MAEAIRSCDQEAEIDLCPLADGGEGTISVLREAMNVQMHVCSAHDALGRLIQCEWAISPDEKTALIEAASIVGFPMLSSREQNPQHTTTFGLGEVLCEAIQQGCEHIFVALGGTSTNDAGFGMAEALGFEFRNSVGEKVQALEKNGMTVSEKLLSIRDILPPKQNNLKNIQVSGLCDVRNPLLGSTGATMTYGKQKGAGKNTLSELEKALTHFVTTIHSKGYSVNADEKYMGAAGGLGFGLVFSTGAELRSGIDFVLGALRFRERCAQTDMVLTGEGCYDPQSLLGKTVDGVRKIAGEESKPVFIFAGRVEVPDITSAPRKPAVKMYEITPRNCEISAALARANEFLRTSLVTLYPSLRSAVLVER